MSQGAPKNVRNRAIPSLLHFRDKRLDSFLPPTTTSRSAALLFLPTKFELNRYLSVPYCAARSKRWLAGRQAGRQAGSPGGYQSTPRSSWRRSKRLDWMEQVRCSGAAMYQGAAGGAAGRVMMVSKRGQSLGDQQQKCIIHRPFSLCPLGTTMHAMWGVMSWNMLCCLQFHIFTSERFAPRSSMAASGKV